MILGSRTRQRVDERLIREALAGVRDPELQMSLPEAGMIESVDVGSGGSVRVTLRLTTPTCPLKDVLVRDVDAALSAVTGVSRVQVSFSAMSERERLELAGRLRAGGPSGPERFGLGSSTQVYAVASGKGGVGKSTVTVNLAAALARTGMRVGVLDADVWGYSIPQMFGVRRAPVALKGVMLPVEAHGVSLMSVGFLVEDDEPVVWRGPMLHKAIEQFVSDVHWGEPDVLLVDLPPGTGDVTISLMSLLPDAALIAVTTPQLAAQKVAERVGRMARDAGMPVAGVVENMTGVACGSCGATTPVFGAGGGARLAESVGAPLLGQVPLDLAIREAGDLGVPAVLNTPDAGSALELDRIARELPVVHRSLVGRPLPLSVV